MGGWIEQRSAADMHTNLQADRQTDMNVDGFELQLCYCSFTCMITFPTLTYTVKLQHTCIVNYIRIINYTYARTSLIITRLRYLGTSFLKTMLPIQYESFSWDQSTGVCEAFFSLKIGCIVSI